MDPISISANYPWLIAQNLEDETLDLFFCSLNNELPHSRCRIPEEQRIRGCFHGWLILSNHPDNNKWSLWNHVTSKIITLPTLILIDGKYESIGECCLSAPPDDPTSILFLTRTDKSSFVFLRINSSKRNKFRWTEMSYAYQIKRLTYDGKLLRCLTCCNGKVFAICTNSSVIRSVIHVDIVVKEKEVVINLMVFGSIPSPHSFTPGPMIEYFKGSSTELFLIGIFLPWETKNAHRIPANVHIYKLDMTCIDWEEMECLKYRDISRFVTKGGGLTKDYSQVLQKSRKTWEKLDDLKDAYFFVDLARDHSVSYGRVIGSELGGFIHIRGGIGEVICSYHVKNDSISLFPIPSPMLPTSHMLMWECRLKDDRGEAKCIVDSKVEMEKKNEILLRSVTDDGVKFSESHLLDAPFNILETIIEFCVGVEYMKFRATCKQCHITAALVKWCNDASLKRLQTYSVVSPWLMVLRQTNGLMTFTDPMLGDNYFMKKPGLSILDLDLFCSRFGWILYKRYDLDCLVFFNPFTNAIRELPQEDPSIESVCFSAPPTSLDCMVVAFVPEEGWWVDILFLNHEQTWRTLDLAPDPRTICFSTFCGGDLYVLGKDGELIVLNNLGKDDCSWKLVEAEAPKGSYT